MKRQDPFMLRNYRFLPPRLKERVDAFLAALGQPHRDFAQKRYVEGKSMAEVAEEMGYAERSLYAIREKVIFWWNIFSERDAVERLKNRVLGIVRKRRVVKHSKLLMSIHLQRSKLTHQDLADAVSLLEAEGIIRRMVSRNGGKSCTIYVYLGDGGESLEEICHEVAN